jgi:hypothetical protein
MSFRIPGAPLKGRPAPSWFGTGKIGIIGTSPNTLTLAPWDDPTWTFWAHSSAVNVMPAGAASLIWDLHPEHVFRTGRKNGFDNYYEWLKKSPTPLMMQRHYTEIPQSVRYPRDTVQALYPYEFGSMTAEMVGLATMMGASHIGFWGVEYADFEYTNLRANTLLWIGIAAGAGVQLIAPKNSRLLKNAAVRIEGDPKIYTELIGDYAYDTHDTPEKYAAERARYRATQTKTLMPPVSALRPVLTETAAALAFDKRLTDPAWRESVETFRAEENIPPELLAREQWQRDVAARQAVIADATKDDPNADPGALDMLIRATDELERAAV